MGMAWAYLKGEFPDAPEAAKEIARTMKKKDLLEFAKTKHDKPKKLPEHVPEKKKKKKKKSKKKSALIQSLIILANQLDDEGSYQIADLIESAARELLETNPSI